MRMGRTLAWTAGVVGVAALGFAVGPRLMHPGEVVAPPPVAEVATPEPVVKPTVSRRARAAVSDRAETAAMREATAREASLRAIPATEPELHVRLKPVLNRGTRMELAAEGFRNGQQFATVAHAAHNTKLPFVVLKHRVLTEGRTLASAIRESKPDADAVAEVSRAVDQAQEDLAQLGNN